MEFQQRNVTVGVVDWRGNVPEVCLQESFGENFREGRERWGELCSEVFGDNGWVGTESKEIVLDVEYGDGSVVRYLSMDKEGWDGRADH